jgi:hypothetical protein
MKEFPHVQPSEIPAGQSNNGRTESSTPAAEDARLLKEAVADPGSVEIEEEEMRPGAAAPVEIGEERLNPEEAGTPLEDDPALITAAIDRPGADSWVQLHPDRVLRTVLLAYQRGRDSSPDYYFVAPALRDPVRRHLRQVCVLLVSDLSGEGDCFLWIVPETVYSPYFNSLI